MASNNYYGGFTHGGTQYPPYAQGGNYATGYATAQPPPAGTAPPQPAYPEQQQYMIGGYTRPAQVPGGSTGFAKPAPPRPAAPSTAYPTYSANTAGTPATAAYGFAQPTQPATQTQKGLSNYDAAVLTAVTAYATGSRGLGLGYKGRGGKGGINKGRPIAKPQTLHYCDVCKISCAGPQTYKEHLDGQKHKKKEASLKTGGPPPPPKGSPAGLRCELCDVICTGQDAYAAHIRGAKHQKVLKLHTKLGKPIPTEAPVVISPPSAPAPVAAPVKQPTNGVGQIALKGFVKPAGTPKINFIGPKTDSRFGEAPKQQTQEVETTQLQQPEIIEKDVAPVGQDYIEEVRGDDGKVVSFNCKLCECRFNDPNAKEMHMKGRRHRLQYKKKVDPNLVVDVKPSSRQKKIEERKAARGPPSRRGAHDGFPRGPPVPLLPPGAPRFPIDASQRFGPSPMKFRDGGGTFPRNETSEDRHMMAKHGEIYPKEAELLAIQKIVSNVEKALKLVSDVFASEVDEKGGEGQRLLKGVMRVGHLAKGLLLRGDTAVHLVVLCSQIPTISLLNRVLNLLPTQLKAVAAEDTYNVVGVPEEASIMITSSGAEPRMEVEVTMTCPLLRGGSASGEAEETLAKDKCLAALAALRHAKWFQARATTLASCVIVIRILRDLAARNQALGSIPSWALELLAEKAIRSAGLPIGPGEGLKMVLEILASGILLPDNTGVFDPCEKEPTDAVGPLTPQQKEDITAFAQASLRKICFRSIHDVLGMEALPRFPKKGVNSASRKRRINEGESADEADGKKEKKENEPTDIDTFPLIKQETIDN